MGRLPQSARSMFKVVAILVTIVALVVGVSLFSIYEASQQIPDFYRQAVALDPEEQRPARDGFVAQAAALASDLHRKGHWQTLFTAEQINAWLALELAAKYPEMLPDGLHDPRISIGENEATIACRYENGDVATVLSLSVDAYLQEPNVLALRIRRARAGALPVPLSQVLDGISQAARQLKLRLEWRKTQGDPVALITFYPGESGSQTPQLQTVELREGELFLAGTIGDVLPKSTPVEAKPLDSPTAQNQKSTEVEPLIGAAEKETRQE